jgi:hypothetical protein
MRARDGDPGRNAARRTPSLEPIWYIYFGRDRPEYRNIRRTNAPVSGATRIELFQPRRLIESDQPTGDFVGMPRVTVPNFLCDCRPAPSGLKIGRGIYRRI